MTSKSVPTFNGSDAKSNKEKKLEEITIKTLKHIEIKTDSVFLRRLGLKENDSISFNVVYLISSYGTTPMDSVQIDTGVKTLDNYMKLMINSLPKFVPALNPETNEAMDYKINMEAKFTVKERKLKAIFAEKREVTNTHPILEGCQNEKFDHNKISCSTTKIYKHIYNKLSKHKPSLPEGVHMIQILVNFSVNEYGKTENVKILRRGLVDEKFEEKIIKAFESLPIFAPIESLDTNEKRVYTLPMTFKAKRNNSYLKPPVYNYERKRNSGPSHIIYNPQSGNNRDRNNYIKDQTFSY
ncbi:MULTISPECIES: hypothetical protein [Flavobacterium]|uniref:hypothetical protein n=1 Tax=Flavobacterium TaxID=237 RepID=UPI001FCC3F64|nr:MULTISPECIES: hypothetical protein [Flavobacterium]UOK42765.1 hypothetical protein LZF87_01230 [Flavobacterium enshiense]